ncbi:MAG: C-terminal helicase domain-containing protein, partial [Balneolales bacterium]|nr:C-terminal helicase domain-containing protein [Balneolales bacterium]
VLEQDIFAFASRAEQVSELFDWHDFNPLHTSCFDTQYRLKEDLAEIISEVFYEGRLKTGGIPEINLTDEVESSSSENPDKTPTKAKRKPRKVAADSKKSFEVVDTSFFEPVLTKKSGGYGFSPANEMHQKVLTELVYQLVMRELIPMEQIGVIVPFRSVVWDMRRALNKKGLTEVEVGTIHTFQGREKRIIIFDTVMSGMIERGEVRHFSVRPFDEAKNGLSVPRLLNVAFSRAKDRLIILADMNHIRRIYGKKFLGRLLERLAVSS